MKATRLASAVFLAFALGVRAQTTNDLAADFSAVRNPSGVWGYGYAGSPGQFTAFTNATANLVEGWNRALQYPFNYPFVGKNLSGSAVSYDGMTILPGQFVMTSGSTTNDQYGMVRFTAPGTGLYEVKAVFSGLMNSGQYPGCRTSTDVHVLVNGAGVFDASVVGQGAEASFTGAFALTLSDGDSVDFLVGSGGNGGECDWVGLSATVVKLRAGIRAVIHPAVEIGWATETNKTYKVQWAPAPQTGDWHDLGPAAPGDGTVQYLFDTTRDHPSRYYRIVETSEGNQFER